MWFENTDGHGVFGDEQLVGTLSQYVSADVGDIDGDGDGDLDLLAVSDKESLTWYEHRLVPNSNDDGLFDSSDLVKVFQAGKYEDDLSRAASFDEGDWNQDGFFDSSDLVLAFQSGHYLAAANPIAEQIAAAIDWLVAENDTQNSRVAIP
ncbi:MAG: hypothetical protein KDB27_03970 [Planctomycetales bacterium]|nr:hypothetical protein [Planctomycetales bacterium]